MLTLRMHGPLYLVRGQSQALTFEVLWPSSQPLTVDPSATLTLYDQNMEKVLDAQPLTYSDPNTGGDGGLSTTTTIPTTTSLSDLWLAEVHIDNQILRQPVMLVLRALHPVITESDLLSYHADLRNQIPPGQTSWDTKIQEAWKVIESRLMEDGRRPYLVMSPYSFREVHLYATLAAIFRDLETYSTGRGKFAELAAHYQDLFDKRWGKLKLTYDYAQEGKPGSAKTGTAGQPVIFLGGNPHSTSGRGY
jgi:hypothetical protein